MRLENKIRASTRSQLTESQKGMNKKYPDAGKIQELYFHQKALQIAKQKLTTLATRLRRQRQGLKDAVFQGTMQDVIIW